MLTDTALSYTISCATNNHCFGSAEKLIGRVAIVPTVCEGFYNIGTIGRCLAVCKSDVIQLEKSMAYKIGAKVCDDGTVGSTISSRFVTDLGPNAPRPKNGPNGVRGSFRS
jgi:hypothetical protein